MGILYTLLVLITIFVSVIAHNREAIVLSSVVFVGSASTMLAILILGGNWDHFNLAILLIDLAMLAIFAWVAFRSNMRWPMLVCAFQFIGSASHLAGMIADTPTTRIIGVAQGIWAYLQCFAIIFGVILNHKRTTGDRKSMPIS